MRENVSLDEEDNHVLEGGGKNAKTKLKKLQHFLRSI